MREMITFLSGLRLVPANRGLRSSAPVGHRYVVGHLLLEVGDPQPAVLRCLGVDYNLAPSWTVDFWL